MENTHTKVVFIFRPITPFRHSIETVFQRIISALPDNVEAVPYVCDANNSIFQTWFQLRRLKGDIYHITGDVNYLAVGLVGLNVVLTVHDLGHYKNLNGLKKNIYGLFWFRIPVLISQSVRCVSNYTLSDLLHYFPSAKKKSSVIFNPAPEYSRVIPLSNHGQLPRILQIGTGPHKNIETVIRAIEGIKCKFVVIGQLSHAQRNLLEDKAISYENHINLSDEQMKHQYAQSTLVVFVSLHEGFGMPVLEAQSMGKPIIISKVCSLPEVSMGTAVELINVKDHKSLKEQIIRIIEDEIYRNEIIEAGFSNLKRFDLNRIASSYYQVYKEILL